MKWHWTLNVWVALTPVNFEVDPVTKFTLQGPAGETANRAKEGSYIYVRVATTITRT